MTTIIIKGDGDTTTDTDTLFNVSSGTLRLRGGVKLQDCAIGVKLNGGNLTVNKATINADENSVYANNGVFTIQNFGGVSISGTVYLASGEKIMVGAPNSGYNAIPNALDVYCESPYDGMTIAEGSANADLSGFANIVSCSNSGFGIVPSGYNLTLEEEQ